MDQSVEDHQDADGPDVLIDDLPVLLSEVCFVLSNVSPQP